MTNITLATVAPFGVAASGSLNQVHVGCNKRSALRRIAVHGAGIAGSRWITLR